MKNRHVHICWTLVWIVLGQFGDISNQEIDHSNGIQVKVPSNVGWLGSPLFSFGAKETPHDSVHPPNPNIVNEVPPQIPSTINNVQPPIVNPISGVQPQIVNPIGGAQPPNLNSLLPNSNLSSINLVEPHLSSAIKVQPSNLTSSDQDHSVVENTKTTSPLNITALPNEIKPVQRNVVKLVSGVSTSPTQPPLSTVKDIKQVRKTRKIVRKKYVNMKSREYPSILLQLCSQEYETMATRYQMIWSKYPVTLQGGKGLETSHGMPNIGNNKPKNVNGIPQEKSIGSKPNNVRPGEVLSNLHLNHLQPLSNDKEIGLNSMQLTSAGPNGLQEVKPNSGNMAPERAIKINGSVADHGLLGTNNEWRGSLHAGTDGNGMPFVDAQHTLIQNGQSTGAPRLEKNSNSNNNPNPREINDLNKSLPTTGSAQETINSNGKPVGGVNKEQDRALPSSPIMNVLTTGGIAYSSKDSDKGETSPSTTPTVKTSLSYLETAMLVFTAADTPPEENPSGENEQYPTTNSPEESSVAENPSAGDSNADTANNGDASNQPADTNGEKASETNKQDQDENPSTQQTQIEKQDLNGEESNIGDNTLQPTECGITEQPSDVTGNDQSEIPANSPTSEGSIEGGATQEPYDGLTTASPEYGQDQQVTERYEVDGVSTDIQGNTNTNTDETQAPAANGDEQNVNGNNSGNENLEATTNESTNVENNNSKSSNADISPTDASSHDAVNLDQNTDNQLNKNNDNPQVNDTGSETNTNDTINPNDNIKPDESNNNTNEEVTTNTNGEATNEATEATNEATEATNGANENANVESVNNKNENIEGTNNPNENVNVEGTYNPIETVNNEGTNTENANGANENLNVEGTQSTNENVENTNSKNENTTVDSTNNTSDNQNLENTNENTENTNSKNENTTVDSTNSTNDNQNLENTNENTTNNTNEKANEDSGSNDNSNGGNVNTEQNQGNTQNDGTQPTEGNYEYAPNTDTPMNVEQKEPSVESTGDVVDKNQTQESPDDAQSSDSPPSYDGEITTIPTDVNHAEGETTSQQENYQEDKSNQKGTETGSYPIGKATVKDKQEDTGQTHENSQDVETQNLVNNEQNNSRTPQNKKLEEPNDHSLNMNQEKVNAVEPKNNLPESSKPKPNNTPNQVETKEEPKVDKTETKDIEFPQKKIVEPKNDTLVDEPKVEKMNKESNDKTMDALANIHSPETKESNDKTMAALADIHSPETVKTENGEGRNIEVLKKDSSSDGKRSIRPMPKHEEEQEVPKPVVENKLKDNQLDQTIPSDIPKNELEQNQEPPPTVSSSTKDNKPMDSPLIVPKEEVKPVVVDKETVASPSNDSNIPRNYQTDNGQATVDGQVNLKSSPSQNSKISEIAHSPPKIMVLGKNDRSNLNTIGTDNSVPSDQGPSGPGWSLFNGFKYPTGQKYGQPSDEISKKREETTTTTSTTAKIPVRNWAWF